MSAKVIQVIEVEIQRGDGVTTTVRHVRQYFAFDGTFLAEYDPCAGNDRMPALRRESCDRTSLADDRS